MKREIAEKTKFDRFLRGIEGLENVCFRVEGEKVLCKA
jgi:hypothetical protein